MSSNGSQRNNDQLWWEARVVVMPKVGVNDPEGEAILGGLRSLGYSEVERVRAGRMIHLRLSAADETTAAARVRRMADTLLANPVIESFEVMMEPAASDVGAER